MCRAKIKSAVWDRYFERNTINKLRVRCNEQKHGCFWEGDLVSYARHHEQCVLKEAVCKCGVKAQRRHLDEHKARRCPYFATFQVTGKCRTVSELVESLDNEEK